MTETTGMDRVSSDVASALLFFFFFQAEDGIRDYKVTGVQTCALPIFERVRRRHAEQDRRERQTEEGVTMAARILDGKQVAAVVRAEVAAEAGKLQIGRASCRERV